MQISPITSFNYNQQKNQTSFGLAKTELTKDALVWSTGSLDFNYKKTSVKPFKQYFKNLIAQPNVKKAIENAPDDIAIDAEISAHDPYVFNIKINKGDRPYSEGHYEVDLKSTTILETEKIANKITKKLETLSKKK